MNMHVYVKINSAYMHRIHGVSMDIERIHFDTEEKKTFKWFMSWLSQ